YVPLLGDEPVPAGVGRVGKYVASRAGTRPVHRFAGVRKPGAHSASRRGPRWTAILSILGADFS
ncbi:MAG: hypothetical protein ABI856_17170, partial [Nitrospira sp.]